MFLLTHAMDTLPVGTAYVVFTGLGGVGAVTLGVLLHGDPITAPRAIGLALVVAGVAVCHAAESGSGAESGAGETVPRPALSSTAPLESAERPFPSR